jgi:anti-sigma B factor antagonist
MDGLDGAVVRVETKGDESVAFVTGELDITGAQRLREAIEGLEQAVPGDGKPGRVVLELSECSFMDSSGLSVLIGAHKRLAEAQIELVLRQPVDKVFRVLDMTGMTRVFTIER